MTAQMKASIACIGSGGTILPSRRQRKMLSHLLLIFGSSLPLPVPRHRQQKKSSPDVPVRPGTVPLAQVSMPYQVSFLKSHRNAALELAQTLLKLSARMVFLRFQLCVAFLCFIPLFPYGGLSTQGSFPQPLLGHRPLLPLSAKIAILCGVVPGLLLPPRAMLRPPPAAVHPSIAPLVEVVKARPHPLRVLSRKS